MSQLYGLSETEALVMDMIWKSGRQLRFSEIMEYFTVHENKAWKKQTLHTYLSRLIKKGALKNSGTGSRNIYEPAMPKEAYIQKWTSDFLEESFDGSLGKFMAALTGSGERLDAKDLEELRQFLDGRE